MSNNYVEVLILTEEGCSIEDGEYEISLKSFTGNLNLNNSGGSDDISLIRDCIDNNIDRLIPSKSYITKALLLGEWEVCYSTCSSEKIYKIINVEHVSFESKEAGKSWPWS